MAKDSKDKCKEFDEALLGDKSRKYKLLLYVSGTTPKSMRAIENINKICSEHLKDRCELEVIDIYQQPETIKEEDIMASPTLVKKLPLPIRKLIGDLSDTEHVLVGLNIIPKEEKDSNE